MKNIYTTISALLFLSLSLVAQDSYLNAKAEDSLRIYQNTSFHDVVYYDEPDVNTVPKNIILFIGDGMGVSHVHAALTANKGQLFLNNFKRIGFQTTYSATSYITDSAAAGTALSTSTKTYDAGIGVSTDTLALENIREKLEIKGLSTGVVSSSAITHATPAAFVAHQPFRYMYEAIAADFLKTNIDVFIGGGYNNFAKREDGRDLITELKNKGYQVVTDTKVLTNIESGKLAGLVAEEHTPSVLEGRGNMLEVATETAIRVLSKNKNGFFVMIEGSQIDWGGHANSTPYIVSETLDMDKAVGIALAFASANKETLVIVTADHETGGMAVTGGDLKTGRVEAEYVSSDHTAIMVPVFAFGPGADLFMGIYDNTDLPKKIMELLSK